MKRIPLDEHKRLDGADTTRRGIGPKGDLRPIEQGEVNVRYHPFAMERWQSTYEHRVRFNLSESGVHPLSVFELLELAGQDPTTLDVHLGYGQSNGSDELRDRIAGLYPNTSEASIIVTTGGAEANFAACWQLMDTDAATAVFLPNYMQVPGLLESFNVPIHPVRLVEEQGWQPDLTELESALAKGARSILITNPNNPTGAVFDRRINGRDYLSRGPPWSVDLCG